MLEVETDSDSKQTSWEICPAEILINVFKYLDAKDLLACRSVSAVWRANADYWGNKSRIWFNLVYALQNKAYNARQRTTLDYKSLHLNYHMWYAVHNAQVKLKHVYHLNEVRNIHVYRDTLIVVFAKSVCFFNLETCMKTKEILEPCLDYNETGHWLVKVVLKEGKKNLILINKRNGKTFETLGFQIYGVSHNKCHLTTWKNSIDFFESTPTGVVVKALGRYYSGGKLLTLHMYRDDMFVYVSKGDVFHRKNGELAIKKVCSLDVLCPPGIWETPLEGYRAMFHMNSVVYGVRGKENEGIKRNVDVYGAEHLVLLYDGLKCAVPHDHILLLGFEDGKVGIVIIENLWITNDLTPAFQFYIHEVADVQQVEAIEFLEVYEGDGCHHVLVGTLSNLYQVVISHADYIKVMP